MILLHIKITDLEDMNLSRGFRQKWCVGVSQDQFTPTFTPIMDLKG